MLSGTFDFIVQPLEIKRRRKNNQVFIEAHLKLKRSEHPHPLSVCESLSSADDVTAASLPT